MSGEFKREFGIYDEAALIPGDFFEMGRFSRKIDPSSFRVTNGLVSGIHNLARNKQEAHILIDTREETFSFRHDIHPSSYIFNASYEQFALSKRPLELDVVSVSGKRVSAFSDMVIPRSLRFDSQSGVFYGFPSSFFSKKVLVGEPSTEVSASFSLEKKVTSESFGLVNGYFFGLKRFPFFIANNLVFVQDRDGVQDIVDFNEDIYPASLTPVFVNKINVKPKSGDSSLFAGVTYSAELVTLSSGKYFRFKNEFNPKTLKYDGSTSSFYVLGKDNRSVFGFKPSSL